MIDFYREIFTKPMVLWSFIEKLAVIGLFIGAMLIIFGIYFVIWFIIQKRKLYKFNSCGNKTCLQINENHCFGCRKYVKKKKEETNA